jgi:transcriptional regulator with XRE-family HTH domain
MSALEQVLDEARVRRSLPDPAIRRLLRERAGLTQAEVARALGVTKTAVVRWEAGARVPRLRVRTEYVALLERLAEEVGLN